MTANIRNFCIIAHIDHGKSTLADRFLELTGTVEKRKMKEQLLDQMDLERERGITIKLQPVRMVYKPQTYADDTLTNADAANNSPLNSPLNNSLLYEELTYKIRGAAFAVRKKIGLGHKEIIYQNALEEEFRNLGLNFTKEKIINILYNGKKIGIYRPDFLVENKIIIEIKALPFISRNEEKQIWTYLKGSEYKLLLLINFSPQDVYFKRIVYDTAHVSECPRKSASSQRQSAFILNLIDTPGHVDFTYEVSRSLAAVEGVVLLVDATQGIQAQTLANYYLAKEQNLTVIPVINKIDLPNARIEEVTKELVDLLKCPKEKILKVSAKTGQGVAELLDAIVERIPPPRLKTEKNQELRALIFDSVYDDYKGVVAYTRLISGQVKKGDKIYLIGTQKQSEVLEVGYFKPEFVKSEKLSAGEIGYIITGLKDLSSCQVGDTITNAQVSEYQSVKDIVLPGYRQVKPMVFAGIFCKEGTEYKDLRESLEKIKLTDASLSFEPENSPALGPGFRCGFLGLLHLEIIQERLRREFGLELIVTAPSVAYKIKSLKHKDAKALKQNKQSIINNQKTPGEKLDFIIRSPQELPNANEIEQIQEPWVKIDVITPKEFMGNIMKLTMEKRGIYLDTKYLSSDRVVLRYEMPLSSILTDFYDKLKSASSGYASLNYELIGYRPCEVERLDILVADELVDALATIVYKDSAYQVARKIVDSLKDVLPRQLFEVKIQAVLGYQKEGKNKGGKIIASARIPAMRKDVTAKLYGGDVTRKMKLLEKQKKGKKKMKTLGQGKVDIPTEAYLSVLKR